jgi:hypothetical protein
MSLLTYYDKLMNIYSYILLLTRMHTSLHIPDDF